MTMTPTEIIFEQVYTMARRLRPVDQARLVAQLAPAMERLVEQIDHPAAERARAPLRGLLADLGTAPSAEEIDEVQREMWTELEVRGAAERPARALMVAIFKTDSRTKANSGSRLEDRAVAKGGEQDHGMEGSEGVPIFPFRDPVPFRLRSRASAIPRFSGWFFMPRAAPR